MYRVTYDADLTRLTTFGIHAGCGCLVEYAGLDDLRQLATERPDLLSGKVFCLGGGSNVLFADERYPGTVLHCVGNVIEERICPADGGESSSVCVRVQAGVVLDRLVDYAAERGYWGLENLAAIPGCVGGAAVQNVGAYGAEFSRCVERVRAFDLDTLQTVEFSPKECEYGYRHSYFKTAASPRLAIFEVDLILRREQRLRLDYAGVRDALGNIPPKDVTPAMIAGVIRKIRSAKLPDPSEIGSAGSYFKNPVVAATSLPAIEESWRDFCDSAGLEHLPLQYHYGADGFVKLSAAWMIDKSGCKQFVSGGAALWPAQPLVIVNRSGSASATDILDLQRMVQNRVEEAFGVRLLPEVVRL